MKKRNLIQKTRHELYFTKEELFIIRMALNSEKEIIYGGSSAEEHEEHHEKINIIMRQIKPFLN